MHSEGKENSLGEQVEKGDPFVLLLRKGLPEGWPANTCTHTLPQVGSSQGTECFQPS